MVHCFILELSPCPQLPWELIIVFGLTFNELGKRVRNSTL